MVPNINPPAPVPVSTPARRPEASFTRAYSLGGASEAGWTTSRCHRLLRPLTSRIEVIRQYGPSGSNGQKDTTTKPIIDPVAYEQGRTTWRPTSNHTLRNASKSTVNEDQDWSPASQPAKRVKHTYRSKGAVALRRTGPLSREKMQTEPPQPLDELMILRSCTFTKTAPYDGMFLPNQRMIQPNPTRTTTELYGFFTKFGGPGISRVYQAFLKALEELFRRTAPHTPRTKGVDSLFNIAVKAVPRYIADEQALLLDNDPDSPDMVSWAVYADLETWGSTNENGWRPLRLLVRYHAISVICDAILDDTIEGKFAIHLVEVCFANDAVEEGYRICNAILSRVHPLALPLEPATELFVESFSLELTIIYHLAIRRSLWGYFFSKITELFEDGVIPMEWLATKNMKDIWNRAILSVTQGDSDSLQAAIFLQTATEFICDVLWTNNDLDRDNNEPSLAALDTALTNTLVNFLALWLAIGELNPSEIRARIIRETVSGLAIRATAALEIATTPVHELSSQQRLRNSLLIFCYIILPAFGPNDLLPPTLTMERAVEEFSTLFEGPDFAQQFSNLIRTTALCCAKVDIDASWTCIQNLVSHVQGLAEEMISKAGTETTPALPKALRRAATTAAVDFAETTETTAHLNWAYELEHLEQEMRSPENRRRRRNEKSGVESETFGFRWEEGIDEWVQKTPWLKKSQQLPQQAEHAPVSPASFDGASSPIRTHGRTGTLAAFTDTPLPLAFHRTNGPHRKTFLGLTATPAPRAKRSLFYGELDGAADSPDIEHFLDLSADFDDVDELSILSDRSMNQNSGDHPKKDIPKQGTISPHSKLRKRVSLPRRSSLGLKRKASDLSDSVQNGYSSSGDELAL